MCQRQHRAKTRTNASIKNNLQQQNLHQRQHREKKHAPTPAARKKPCTNDINEKKTAPTPASGKTLRQRQHREKTAPAPTSRNKKRTSANIGKNPHQRQHREKNNLRKELSRTSGHIGLHHANRCSTALACRTSHPRQKHRATNKHAATPTPTPTHIANRHRAQLFFPFSWRGTIQKQRDFAF